MTEELIDEETELWFLGRMVEFIDKDKLNNKMSLNSIPELVQEP
jgi:hypothetical protein